MVKLNILDMRNFLNTVKRLHGESEYTLFGW